MLNSNNFKSKKRNLNKADKLNTGLCRIIMRNYQEKQADKSNTFKIKIDNHRFKGDQPDQFW